jgi:hypothetical protein
LGCSGFAFFTLRGFLKYDLIFVSAFVYLLRFFFSAVVPWAAVPEAVVPVHEGTNKNEIIF